MAESFASSSTQTGRSIRPPTASPHRPRFYIRTLGCKVNQVDSESVHSSLTALGFEWTADPELADAIVVNTCTVTAESDKKSRKAARHFARLGHSPCVVVTGCMVLAGTGPQESLGESVIVVPERDQVAPTLAQRLEVPGDQGNESPATAGMRSRNQLKVQDGCDNHCTYCIVPKARGASRSVASNEVVAAAERCVSLGTREVVLTGIDLGDYEDSGRDLADLVSLVASTGIARVRLSSVEPMHLDAGVLERLAQTPAFCRHLHIPLQSGSDQMLAAMNRPYTAEEYLSVLENARKVMPDVAITTDLMVGFPGESDAHAGESLAVCERAGFSRIHVFKYSSRPGTPASGLVGAVAPEVSKARSEAARNLGARLADEFADSHVGQEAELLVECPAAGMDPDWVEGTTREYLRVAASAPGVSAGDIVAVRIVGGRGSRVLAELS